MQKNSISWTRTLSSLTVAMISYPINNNTFVKFTRPSSDESHQMTWHIVQTCSVCECLVFRESSPFFPTFCHQPWQHILFLSTLNEKNISFFAIAPFVRVPFHTTPSMLEAFIADRHDLCWNSTSALIAKVLLVLEHKRLIHNYKLLNWELQLYKKKHQNSSVSCRQITVSLLQC